MIRMAYTKEEMAAYQKARRMSIKQGKKVRKRKPATVGNTRRCTQCKQWKELSSDYFYASMTYCRGYQPKCKHCMDQHALQYYHDNIQFTGAD